MKINTIKQLIKKSNMKTKANTLLDGQDESLNTTDKLVCSEELELYSVKGTPFTVAREKSNWYVLMGKYRMTEELQTKEDAIENAKAITWDRIVSVVTILGQDGFLTKKEN